MNFEPINIKIDNLKTYTEVAYIIDRPSFIKEAKKLRKKYGIKKPLRKLSPQEWLLANTSEEKISEFYRDVTDLRIFFSYDSNYEVVFEKAVLGCNIENGDYQSTNLVNFSRLPHYLTNVPTTVFGILLTPQTDKKDVIAAFNRYKTVLEEFQSDADSYSLTDKRIDKKNEIKRDRNWYWERKQGMSYWQIAEADGVNREDYDDFYKDRIAKAIKIYKKKLGIK